MSKIFSRYLINHCAYGYAASVSRIYLHRYVVISKKTFNIPIAGFRILYYLYIISLGLGAFVYSCIQYTYGNQPQTIYKL